MAASTRIEGVAPPPPGKSLRVDVGGAPVAVFNVGGEFFAIGARCTHVGGPLEQGAVAHGDVTCPWHGSVFRLSDGGVVRGPATSGVRAYRVTRVGETLTVESK